MSEKGEIRCHECLFSADGIYNAPYRCNYATLTGHCRTKIARRKGPDGVWRKVKTVETPEECTRFLPRKGHQQRKLQRDAKKAGDEVPVPQEGLGQGPGALDGGSVRPGDRKGAGLRQVGGLPLAAEKRLEIQCPPGRVEQEAV